MVKEIIHNLNPFRPGFLLAAAIKRVCFNSCRFCSRAFALSIQKRSFWIGERKCKKICQCFFVFWYRFFQLPLAYIFQRLDRWNYPFVQFKWEVIFLSNKTQCAVYSMSLINIKNIALHPEAIIYELQQNIYRWHIFSSYWASATW